MRGTVCSGCTLSRTYKVRCRACALGCLQTQKPAELLTCLGIVTVVKSVFGGGLIAALPGPAFLGALFAPEPKPNPSGPNPPTMLFIFLSPCSSLSTRNRLVALSRRLSSRRWSGASLQDIGEGCRRSAGGGPPYGSEGARAVGRTTRPEADIIPPWSVARHKYPTVASSSARWVRRRIDFLAPPFTAAAIANAVIDGGLSASVEPTRFRQIRRSWSVSRELPSEPGAASIFCGSQTLAPLPISVVVTVAMRSPKDLMGDAIDKSTRGEMERDDLWAIEESTRGATERGDCWDLRGSGTTWTSRSPPSKG